MNQNSSQSMQAEDMKHKDIIQQFYKGNHFLYLILQSNTEFHCLTFQKLFKTYIQDPTQQAYLRSMLAQMTAPLKIKQTESTLCSKILKKHDKAFKCLDCLTEDNSILCSECFQLQFHKNHRFEKIEVYGGCCDCGDDEKWNPEGFCSKHRNVMEQEINISNQQYAIFRKTFTTPIYVLFALFKQNLLLKKQIQQVINPIILLNKKKQLLIIKKQMNKYTQFLFQQLANVNKGSLYANEMTRKMFEEKMPQEYTVCSDSSNKLMDQLFSMYDFECENERMCDLCISMFTLPNFRKSLTIYYFNRYNHSHEFATSYGPLSAQLFTSHKIISELILKGQLKQPLVFKPKIKNVKNKDQILKIAQSFTRYYYDLCYLSKLYGDASIQYLQFHARQKKMRQLCYHGELFNGVQGVIDFFGLEIIYFNKLESIIKTILKDHSKQIIKHTLQDLYSYISRTPMSPQSSFYPHHRTFAIFSYIYLQGDLTQLEKKEKMHQFVELLNIKQPHKQITIIFNAIMTPLWLASQLIDNQNKINQQYTFFSFYLRKSCFLFGFDAFLVKLLIKIGKYLGFEGLFNCDNVKRLGFNIEQKYQQFKEQQDQPVRQQNIIQITKIKQRKIQQKAKQLQISIKVANNFVGFIFQAMFSDLPEINIDCYLDLNQKSDLKWHYYDNILKSFESYKIQQVGIKQFKDFVQNFFKEEKVFKDFVKQKLDQQGSRKILSSKSKGQSFNISYFRSLKMRVNQQQFVHKLEEVPYKSKYEGEQFLLNSYLFQILKKWLIVVLKMKDKYQSVSWVSLISGSVEELCKIYIYTKNEDVGLFLKNLLISYDLSQISIYSTLKSILSFEQVMKQQQIQKKKQIQKQRRKQLKSSKLKLINQKLSKQANEFSHLFEHQSQQQNNETHQCIICHKKTQQNLFYCCFISQTNYFDMVIRQNQKQKLENDDVFLVFSTCNHVVHLKCFNDNHPKNRVYSFCHACKQPVNCVVPINSNKFDKQDQLTLTQILDKMLSIRLCIIEKQQNKNTEVEKLIEELVSSIITTLLFSALLPQAHTKKHILPITKSIFLLLKNHLAITKQLDLIQNFSQTIHLKTKTNNQKIDQKFNIIKKYVINSILEKQKNLVECLWMEQVIKYFLGQGEVFLGELELGQFEGSVRQLVKIPQLDNNLIKLSNKYLRQCPNCGQVTNLQAICMQCPNFSTCLKCNKVSLMVHSNQKHHGINLFIRTQTGEPSYIFRNRYWTAKSLYQNYILRSYKIATPQKEDYNLNLKRFQELREDIFGMNIERKLRLKEFQMKKVNFNQMI